VVATITTVVIETSGPVGPCAAPNTRRERIFAAIHSVQRVDHAAGGTVVAEIGGGQLVVLPVRSYAAKAAVTALNSSFKLCLTT
jgi:hypothetical protein